MSRHDRPNEDHLPETAELVDRLIESIRAVVKGEENRYRRALAALRTLAEKESIPMATVRGMAAISSIMAINVGPTITM